MNMRRNRWSKATNINSNNKLLGISFGYAQIYFWVVNRKTTFIEEPRTIVILEGRMTLILGKHELKNFHYAIDVGLICIIVSIVHQSVLASLI